ncbi:MAG: DUF45 domain-containing protein [Lentisphaeria bacterium]|nr:DUF45 domain-containing protein [Lentisphaeria bacterium]
MLNSKTSEIYHHPELGEITIEFSPRRTRAAIGVTIIENQVCTILKLPFAAKKSVSTFIPFINSHADWIQKQQNNLQKQLTVHTFEIGDSFFYLGRQYPLIQGTSSRFDGENFYVSTHSPELNKRELKKIYLRLAENFIVPLCRQYAADFGLTIGNIRIKNAEKRWGSCNSKGDINFAWHLVMCPENFIRHTICHELAHRIHMNHSRAFYQTLKKFYPFPVPPVEQWKYRPF